MAQATFPDDVLPPEGTYDSREALLAAIKKWAAPRGYAFITGRSSRSTSGRQIITYACDRWCRPPSVSKDRQRKTTTRGTNCRFSIIAKESLDKATWSLRHRPDGRFHLHNHEPSWHKSAHPVHRQLSDADKSTVSRLTNAGVAPKDIRTYIRQNSNTIATQQDIYNRIADSKRELCEGQSTIHAFANQLDKEGFWNRMRLDSDDRITAVLFAHPESLAYLQAYPDLLFLDYTYKTNKYGMPLLNMIGVDACQRSFCIAFAFLSGETEQDYLWALDRLRSLPPLLPADIRTPPTRIRGLQQGLADWNEFFNHWHSIMKSPDEKAFDQRVQEVERRYLPQYIEEVGYIKANCLDPYKERLVRAWVDQHPHFGNVVTWRVEGIHGLLKSHLKKSTLDLFEAWRAMKHTLLNQLAELQSNQASQQMRIPIELSGSLYSTIRGWVSHEALRKVEEQRKLLLKKHLPICTDAFSRSHGLPCAHTLKALQEQNQPLRLEHFHTHWHLNRHGVHRLLLEPRHRPDRIAAGSSTSRPQSSAQRQPSAFETVQATARPKAQPKCSRCHQIGHTMTSKTCPQRYEELLKPPAPSAQARPLPTTSSSAVSEGARSTSAMGKRCDTANGSRDWTKEEMMAYLDWSKAEDDRVEAQVAAEMERSPFSSRRGMHDIWEAAAADSEAQQAIHSQ
ncbi:transposase [Fusarium mundagurra]|uniref:Transposase n=1 Tax=Fusarium mundagurra TaxID=1567541 RepID=A0A8H6D5Z9_9HYPO|nr:transposase [Fusarium mundagurra]